jgi:hypothetical protein
MARIDNSERVCPFDPTVQFEDGKGRMICPNQKCFFNMGTRCAIYVAALASQEANDKLDKRR